MEKRLSTRTRWAIAIGVTIAGAPTSYVVQRTLEVWGVLDQISNSLGRWLKVNIAPEAIGWSIAASIFLILWAWIVWWLWTTKSAQKSDNKETNGQRGLADNQWPTHVNSPLLRASPDLMLGEVLDRVYAKVGPSPLDEQGLKFHRAKIDMEVSDAVVENEMGTWGRKGIGYPRLPISLNAWRQGRFEHIDNTLSLPVNFEGGGGFTDLHFCKHQVDQIWPPPEPDLAHEEQIRVELDELKGVAAVLKADSEASQAKLNSHQAIVVKIQALQSLKVRGENLLNYIKRSSAVSTDWPDTLKKVDEFGGEVHQACRIANVGYDAEGLYKPYFTSDGLLSQGPYTEEEEFNVNVGFTQHAINEIEHVTSRLLSML